MQLRISSPKLTIHSPLAPGFYWITKPNSLTEYEKTNDEPDFVFVTGNKYTDMQVFFGGKRFNIQPLSGFWLNRQLIPCPAGTTMVTDATGLSRLVVKDPFGFDFPLTLEDVKAKAGIYQAIDHMTSSWLLVSLGSGVCFWMNRNTDAVAAITHDFLCQFRETSFRLEVVNA